MYLRVEKLHYIKGEFLNSDLHLFRRVLPANYQGFTFCKEREGKQLALVYQVLWTAYFLIYSLGQFCKAVVIVPDSDEESED